MRVFVTGATGFVGSAVVRVLLSAGHTVSGLVRSEKSAQALKEIGAEPFHGSLDDPSSLKRGAAAADGVIHLGFVHDFTNYEDAVRTDREAIEAMGAALAGSNRPLIVTSGTLLLPQGRLVTEADTHEVNSNFSIRGQSEVAARQLASQGVRSCVVRLAPTVHGNGDKAFIPAMVNVARKSQVSMYIGDGSNRWPAVHRLDAARLFLLALEKGAAGSTYHGVSEEGVPIKAIAEIISEKLNVPVKSVTLDTAVEQFNFLAYALACDNPTSSQKTRDELGWTPAQPELLDDLRNANYFETPAETYKW